MGNRAGSRIFCRGGVDPFWGGFGLQHGHFSVKMYVKTKELGPVRGVHRHAPPDLPMGNITTSILHIGQ